ncbi:Fic family protein [Gordonia sp. MP11Mi]|uniref:Fido domain-containing protein n=1 Tax=Gordonia sp. MP11Mi TaxID=3022769 RepID=A0AA97GUT0_9ACTN
MTACSLASIVTAIPTDLDAALDTVAHHWGEFTGVHPFRDGNSRTQQFFFTDYLRESDWALDWNAIDDTAVHAARHVAMSTTDSSYLAAALRQGTGPANDTYVSSGAAAAAAVKDGPGQQRCSSG